MGRLFRIISVDSVITRILEVEAGGRRASVGLTQWQKDGPLLALKMAEATNQGMWVVSGSWKRQKMDAP